jgi:integrase
MSKRGNGEGSIRKRNNGLWEGQYTAGRDPLTGKLKRGSVYAKTRAECRAKLDAALARASGGFYGASERLTVTEWLHIYLWDIKRPKIKPVTFEGYDRSIRLYIAPAALAKMKLVDVRRFHVQGFVDELTGSGASAFTVRNAYVVIRNAFSEAEKRGIIPISYAGRVELPKRTPKPTAILSQATQADFIAALAGHRLRAAFILALTTGIRAGELAALTWEDYKDGHISITKNAVRIAVYDSDTSDKTGSKVIIQNSPKTAAGIRTIPIMAIAAEALRAHRMRQNDERIKNRLLYVDNGLIFCNEIGGIYEPKYYLHALYKLLDAAELPRVKFHALRHTFATRGLEAGLSTKELQNLLGHESPEMVMHYQHILDEQKRAAIDKMSKLFNYTTGSDE